MHKAICLLYNNYFFVTKSIFITIVFVDSSDQCNMLNFQLGVNGVGTTISASRSWNLKVR